MSLFLVLFSIAILCKKVAKINEIWEIQILRGVIFYELDKNRLMEAATYLNNGSKKYLNNFDHCSKNKLLILRMHELYQPFTSFPSKLLPVLRFTQE